MGLGFIFLRKALRTQQLCVSFLIPPKVKPTSCQIFLLFKQINSNNRIEKKRPGLDSWLVEKTGKAGRRKWEIAGLLVIFFFPDFRHTCFPVVSADRERNTNLWLTTTLPFSPELCNVAPSHCSVFFSTSMVTVLLPNWCTSSFGAAIKTLELL